MLIATALLLPTASLEIPPELDVEPVDASPISDATSFGSLMAGIAEASLHTTSDFFSIQEKQAEQEAGVDGSQRHPGGNS